MTESHKQWWAGDVPLEHAPAPREDLAARPGGDVGAGLGVDDPDLHARPRRPRGLREFVARHRGIGERDDAAELGGAVGVEEGGVRVGIAERLPQARRALDVHEPNGAQVGHRPVGMVEERLVHRREDAEVERRPLLLDLAERGPRLEVDHAREPRVGEQRRRERQDAAHVAERQRAPPDVLARRGRNAAPWRPPSGRPTRGSAGIPSGARSCPTCTSRSRPRE